MKKQKKGIVGWEASALVIILLLLFSFTSAWSAEPPPIELKFAHLYPNIAVPAWAMQYFADTINKRSNGRVKITMYPGQTLLQAFRIYEGVLAGISDIGCTSPQYTASRFPANDSMLLPLPIGSAWSFSRAAHDWYEHFRPKEFDDTHMFYYSASGPFTLASRDKPIVKPEDLKGLKVRVPGGPAVDFVKALGGTPVAMPMGEAYEAISRGVVDALLIPTETLKGYKHGDVTKYVTILPLSFGGPCVTFMNLTKWNSLPKDIQKIFTDAIPEIVEGTARAWWYGDITGEEYFLSLGGGRKIIDIPPSEVSAWTKLVLPLRDAYIADKKTLPAAEYIKYLDERIKYWNDRQPNKKACVDWVEKELVKGSK
jgi:TRAP-type transport system periplasmic protein